MATVTRQCRQCSIGMDVKVPRLGSLPTATQDDGALAESWRKWGEILPKLFAERLGLIVYALTF